MEQFALALVYPRSIAWLIRSDEWERFEKIVNYNCAMVGGYFNIFLPLTDEDTLSEKYQRFLIDYDPDLIVLAPGMGSNDLNSLQSPHPFAIIPYEHVSQVARLDAWGGGSGLNVTLGSEIVFNKEISPIKSFVAVADDKYPDTSRLALVACGDVEPREPMWHVMDEDVSLDATGHREIFLMKQLKPELDQVQQTKAYVDEEGNIVRAPDRYRLAGIISEESQFPLSGGVKILETCYRLQEHFDLYQSFVGLTASYKKGGGTRPRVHTPKQAKGEIPSLVLLVSDRFNLEEAILFWNLRANGFFVSWLPFSEIEKDMVSIVTWLESDYGGGFYSMFAGGLNIVFSSSKGGFTHLEVLFNSLLKKKQEDLPHWHILPYDDLVFYDYIRPCIRQERVSVVEFIGKHTFIPKLPSSYSSGIYTVVLQWDGLMLPQSGAIVRNLISSEKVEGMLPFYRNGRRIVENAIHMPKFRLTSRRYLEAQIGTDEPITFERPTLNKVIETLFKTTGYSRIEFSSTARYHMIFLERIGGLEKAQQYLATLPYRELLELLSDNDDKKKAGWILTNPSKRRAINHLQLWEVLGKVVPDETKTYVNNISDILPEEAVNLLEMGILERGFQLHCAFCSYRSWYPAEHVGQTFECARCFQKQIYRSNPLWLYKLPEVIFQGFKDNMQVPLLALHYLARKSRKGFESVPDSNVYWVENDDENHRNIDILCLSDGNFYIGEAKSNDEIERDQFSFYENISKRVAIDGIVFATSKPQWKRATLQRIEELKSRFDGEVLILTGHNLYPNTSAT